MSASSKYRQQGDELVVTTGSISDRKLNLLASFAKELPSNRCSESTYCQISHPVILSRNQAPSQTVCLEGSNEDIVKGSHCSRCIRHSELLFLDQSSKYQKTQRFGNWTRFARYIFTRICALQSGLCLLHRSSYEMLSSCLSGLRCLCSWVAQ
jgi:hypothetical protein